MASTPDERKFVTFRRGYVRDNIILAHFRNELSTMVNPDTGVTFTADEIARATQPGSRFYVEADAIDLLGQAQQSRALWFANQIRPLRANTRMLEDYHGQLWLGTDSRLPPVGGSGTVYAPATASTVFPGSTTLGDPSAAVATDPNGNRYQVLANVTTPASGIAVLTMQGIDGGAATNIADGTVLTWSQNKPLGAENEATVDGNETEFFTGGFDEESDYEYAQRIEERIRYRPAQGNAAHFMTWARQSSAAVESAFIYPCAFHAGSVMVCVLQKRSSSAQSPEGPTIRVNPAAGTLSTVTNFLVPSYSPVVPEHAYVVVVSPTGQTSDLTLRVGMNRGTIGGWYDVNPWPIPTTTSSYPDVQVSSVTSQTEFVVQTDTELPDSTGAGYELLGVNAPSIMAWNPGESRFERLLVSKMTQGTDQVTVELSTDPDVEIVVGTRISPYTALLGTIAISLEDYFDSLGPGEVVDTDDTRYHRAMRFPSTSDQYPSRAGQALISDLIQALDNAASDAELESISRSAPDVPADIIDGPNQVILGEVNVYPYSTE
jgi:uncharacterized phage protein gp47/JayE